MKSDTKLINVEALDEIIKRYSGYVYTIVYNILGGKMQQEDLEECVSDVFVSLWRGRDKIDEDKPIEPYLAAIARNTAKNKLRKLKFELSLEDDEIVVYDKSNIEEEIETSEMMFVLDEVINALPEKEKEIFIRHYYYGQSLSNIADKLCIREGALRVKIHRIRKKIRGAFTERGYSCEI